MGRYNNDPYFTTAKFNSICPETGLKIKKGDTIAYYPKGRKAYHADSRNAADLRNMDFNEAFNMPDANW